MKKWNVNTESVVDFRTTANKYVSLPGGVKYYAHCSGDDFISAGLWPYSEEKLESGYVAEGWEVALVSGIYIKRPINPVLDEDAALTAALAAIDADCEAKLVPVRDGFVALSLADGPDLETKLDGLRADYQRILAARNAAIDALFG